jgi:DNA-binding CsgD family transcriptional regulator
MVDQNKKLDVGGAPSQEGEDAGTLKKKRLMQKFFNLLQNDFAVDQDVVEEHVELTSKLNEMDRLGPQWFYIFNFNKMAFEFVSPDYLDFLGLAKEEFERNPKKANIINFVEDQQQEVLVEQLIPQVRTFRNQYERDEILDMNHQWSYSVNINGKYYRILDQFRILELTPEKHVALVFGRLSVVSEKAYFRHLSVSIHQKQGRDFELIYFKNFSPLANQLSKRELEVLVEHVKGRTSAEIGKNLYISENTVNRHKQNMLEKLEIDNPKELTHFAVLNGIY